VQAPASRASAKPLEGQVVRFGRRAGEHHLAQPTPTEPQLLAGPLHRRRRRPALAGGGGLAGIGEGLLSRAPSPRHGRITGRVAWFESR